MKTRAILVAVAVATFGSAWVALPAGATTIPVSCTAGQPNNLQSQLTAAPSGSTIRISGTCTGQFIVPSNKTLTLAGPATLDGGGSGTVLTISSGDNVGVQYLTIRHGTTGVSVQSGGTATLTSTKVAANTNGGFGGVAGIDNSGTMTLNSSTVSGNTESGVSGTGGINNSGTMTLNGSTVSGNTAVNSGTGGILTNGPATTTLNSSTVSGNTAPNGDGIGGIFSLGSTTLNSSNVSNNRAGSGSSGSGGGVFVEGTLTVTSSHVTNNTAGDAGGGIDTEGGTVSIRSSTVSGNTAGNTGGGIEIDSGTVTLNGSAVTNNHAGTAGGGIFVAFGGTVAVQQSNVSGNTPDDCNGC